MPFTIFGQIPLFLDTIIFLDHCRRSVGVLGRCLVSWDHLPDGADGTEGGVQEGGGEEEGKPTCTC